MLRAALLAALITAFSAQALAAPPCAPRQQYIDHLRDNYNEAVVGMGLTAGGGVLELFAASTGTWTIIVTRSNGISCGVASGTAWEPRPEPTELETKGPPA